MAYANALFSRVAIRALAGRPEAVLPAAEEMRALADASNLKFLRATGSTYVDWARVHLGELSAEAFRAGLAAYADLGAEVYLSGLQYLLADVELTAGRREEALAAVDRGLAQAAETGVGLNPSILLRLRGDALSETDPDGAASAYREAIAVAEKEGARPLALRAALPLARLCQSAGRPVEAHDALAPALEGFSPTPEWPAIAEAQALLASLAADEAVAAELRKREVRSKLHTGYALATMMSKGFASEETSDSAQSRRRACRSCENAGILDGSLWPPGRRLDGGEARRRARGCACVGRGGRNGGTSGVRFRRAPRPRLRENHRRRFCGRRRALQHAVADYEETRDAELNALFGHDLLANAMSTLAQATWYLGDVAEAERLADAAITRAKTTGRVVSEIQAINCRGFFAVQADRPQILLEIGQQILALADRHGIAYWKTVANQSLLWARVAWEPLADAYREDLARNIDSGGRLMMALRYTSLAEVERTVGRTAAALAAIEQALAIGAENGEGELLRGACAFAPAFAPRATPSQQNRISGRRLNSRKHRARRLLTLFAALDLAKFLQARRREAEGYAILALALEGLSPTPELPAIAAAKTLLTELRS